MRTTIIFFISLMLLTMCSQEQPKEEHTTHQHDASEKYTCPMHPQVVQDKAGTCPICGMELVKVNKAKASDISLMLTDSQIKLANITTQRIEKKPIGQAITINGRLAVNEEQSKVISSRVEGRIEKLFIKETGKRIQKGKPLYTLYSETLLTLQQEYLLAKTQYETIGKNEDRYKSFLESSEKKLLLYGLTKHQINKLNANSLKPSITFLSQAYGVVTEINATEGQYITEGRLLYRLEDLSKLWVEAELYPNERPLVKIGDKLHIRVNDVTKTSDAIVTFLSPEFKENTQIMIMRASLENAASLFKPGQQVQIELTHSTKQAFTLPTDAVIRSENGTHVYVQSGRNTFEPRMVNTGIESFEQVEILTGLNEGDTVVASGAYLLYSEIILKKGQDPIHMH